MNRFLLWLLPVCAPAAIDFNREIRPILSDRCFTCHGPAAATRRANLRLDQEASVQPKTAAILARITATGAQRMPPVFAGAALSARETDLLKQWISEGAKFQKHWSLIPPQRDRSESIDSLIRQKLTANGLTPAPPAGQHTLIRRASLDLTGLPPTPAELSAFLNDSTPQAYERVVERLLASPRYAERMAARWLDAARYADTNGYQTDAERFMWRWRDWVIEAFNKNMPFDQFTIEQLAGDLLPNPTRAQLIATGFNRNHRANGEGGSIDAEFMVEYAIDRVETTSTTWLGLTAGCARCHDHKYDPISQKEFYSLYAFFNNLPEKGKVFKYGNSPPLIPAPTPDQEQELAAWDQKLASAEARFAQLKPAAQEHQRDWQKTLDTQLAWLPSEHLAARFDNEKAPPQEAAAFGFYDKFTLAAWIKPAAPTGAVLTKAVDQEEQPGYGLYLKDGKLQVNLVQRWLDDCLRVETEEPIVLNEWTHAAMTYDGSLTAGGIKIYVNGRERKLKYLVDDLNQTVAVKEPLRVGGGNGLKFTGEIAEARAYSALMPPAEIALLADRAPLAESTPEKRERAFLEEFAPAGIKQAWTALKQVRRDRQKYVESLPTVMVMREMSPPRDAFVLNRGQYDRPTDRVTRAIPAALGTLADSQPNRLTLAKWIVDRQNPLTARVTVNRFWQMLFGAGLVRTAEDFGSQGEWPINLELLDWLAVDFMEHNWDVKHLLKTIVMSQTYQQSSRITQTGKDPENRLLSRGPRVRLAPEMVRDQALAAAGLLVEKLGGPSVKPYQPAGLWKELSGGEDYQRDKGENLYRRSLYTFWKRAAPPPGMMTFDSAGREACTVLESRTNTPLQALTLMNDETYLEAARKIAERMMKEGGSTESERISHGFTLLLSRPATKAELQLLTTTLHRQRDRFETTPAEATKLLAQGDSPRDEKLHATELAAYTLVASTILNLDEAVTKE